jgi:hypothetical protein
MTGIRQLHGKLVRADLPAASAFGKIPVVRDEQDALRIVRGGDSGCP